MRRIVWIIAAFSVILLSFAAPYAVSAAMDASELRGEEYAASELVLETKGILSAMNKFSMTTLPYITMENHYDDNFVEVICIDTYLRISEMLTACNADILATEFRIVSAEPRLYTRNGRSFLAWYIEYQMPDMQVCCLMDEESRTLLSLEIKVYPRKEKSDAIELAEDDAFSADLIYRLAEKFAENLHGHITEPVSYGTNLTISASDDIDTVRISGQITWDSLRLMAK